MEKSYIHIFRVEYFELIPIQCKWHTNMYCDKYLEIYKFNLDLEENKTIKSESGNILNAVVSLFSTPYIVIFSHYFVS